MTEQRPLVSIGIPVYNGEKFLRQALDALLEQTYTHLEFVIADNGSVDGTEVICRQYAERDSRIRYYRNPTNIGVYANFRRVVELSSGEYFLWAAVDDLRPPAAIEDCVNALLADPRAVMAHGVILVEVEGSQALFSVTNAMDLSANDAGERVRTFTTKMTHNAMLYGLYRRSALSQGWLGSCYGQDYLLCLQMCLLGPVVSVEKPMMVCRERKPVPNNNPMYAAIPLTVRNLLRVGGLPRRKCWVVLLKGCYYLGRIQSVSINQRVLAIVAHVVTFSTVYRIQLVKEILFQMFEPLAWLSTYVWQAAQRQPSSLRFARRVQTLLTRG
jgi:glycosyltransferase involved in cell wall biosynthesis